MYSNMKNHLQQTIDEIQRFESKRTKQGAVMLRKQLMGLTKHAKDLRAEVLKDSKTLTKSKPAEPKKKATSKKETSKKASLREQEPKKKTMKEVMTELAEDASRL